MTRVTLALLAVLVATGATACTGTEVTLPPASPASLQEAQVNWVESTSSKPPRLVFQVERIHVTPNGWSARVAIRNDTGVGWSFGDSNASTAPFGVMLFVTGAMDELERRIREGELPGLRGARTIRPVPPETLEPGQSWEGTIAAPGALAAGRWLRVVFGPLRADGQAPPGLGQELSWITDNALQLRG